MTAYTPVHRLTVYAPRSVDITESTVLTPIGGAPHSDQFIVTDAPGIGSDKPYLIAIDGQTGTVNPSSKATTVGSRSITLGDKALIPGSNAARWVSAFLGDATARLQLKGCKTVLEESVDGGSTWTTIFTGRVGDIKLGDALSYIFEIKSSVEDLKKNIFVYDPLPTATYAFRSSIFPPRLTKQWGTGDGTQAPVLPAGAWLSGTISGKFTGTDGIVRADITLDNTGEDLKTAALVTKQGLAFASGLAAGLVFLKVTAGGATGGFAVPKHTLGYAGFYDNNVSRRYLQKQIGHLQELPASHPLHLAMPANGTAITFYVQSIDTTPISKTYPLFIDDVDPIQLWADILDGYFSIPNTNYTARPLAPRDTTAFTNLLGQLPRVRFIVTKPEKAGDWIVANICQPFNLAYRVDGLGRVVPIDLRVSSSTTTSGSIVDTDVTELPTNWGLDGSQALLGAAVTYYVDSPKQSVNLRASSDPYPDMNAALVDSTSDPWLVINPLSDLARDAGDTITAIDAQGIRLTTADFNGGAGSIEQVDGHKLSKVTDAMFSFLAPFAGGAIGVQVKCKRSSSFGSTGAPGQLWTLTISTLPDPATNQRGGSRVCLCTSRTEQGLDILGSFIDLGSATVANTPTIGTLAITNGGLDVPYTPNAAGDPVQVEYIITAAGTGSRPAATDPTWTIVGAQLKLWPGSSATARQQGIPANTRLWVRARSRPTSMGSKLPSAYVFPAGGAPAGSIDVAAITAPTIAAATGVTGNRATIPWTNGDATQQVEVFLNAGGIPGSWTDAMRVQPTLPPGSTTVQLRNLTPSATYGVAVRHRDIYGGTSAFSAETFATTGSPSTAPLTPPLGIGGGGGATGSGIDVAPIVPGPRIDVPVGISLLLAAADPSFNIDIQTAPDSAGSPNLGAISVVATKVSGRTRVYHVSTPLDGAIRWFQTRHSGFGDTASNYGDWVKGVPSIQNLDGPTNALATPLNGQSRFRCKVRKLGTQAVASGSFVSVLWDVEDFDIGALHDTGSNTNRIVIPPGGDVGLWLLICNWELLSNATSGLREIQIRNNSGNILGAWQDPSNAGGDIQGQVFAVVDSPSVGTWFEVIAAQTSGVSQNFNGGGLLPNFQAIHIW